MRLEKIKLVGFKSFVDPTTIQFPGNLVGIVGPNGCGKSNVIDAVRWVMGESSAKNLRGESLTDVIFNGTTQRKPVGRASIELVFDNRDGRVGGEYAQYAQIAIKREVDREDGQSTYFLNNTRCRRRDITDIFLGTGLGPRSYSIIEQGMISKLIEAKPDELRAHLEEVAGISKYKERRRETENRIKHTRENLERLKDLRDEVGKQLQHLKRQADAASQYQVLKTEEQLLKAQSLSLRWQSLHARQAEIEKELVQHRLGVAQKDAEAEHHRREVIEHQEAQHELSEAYEKAQTHYYQLGNEITRLEQMIRHQQEKELQLHSDFNAAQSALQDSERHATEEADRIEVLMQEIEIYRPILEAEKSQASAFRAEEEKAESALAEWQQAWEVFNQQSAATSQTAQVEQTRIQQIEERQWNAQKRLDRLQVEKTQLDATQSLKDQASLEAELDTVLAAKEAITSGLQNLQAELEAAKINLRQAQDRIYQDQKALQIAEGQYASLQTLQEQSLTVGQKVKEWLLKNHLQDHPRLMKSMEVQAGYETLVEAVLEQDVQALVCENFAFLAEDFPRESLTLLLKAEGSVPLESFQGLPCLAQYLTAPKAVLLFLSSVFVCDSLTQALACQASLGAHQRVITKEGILLGPASIKFPGVQDASSGVIAREKELTLLEAKIATLNAALEAAMDAKEAAETSAAELELAQQEEQKSHQQTQAKFSELKSKIHVISERVGQIQRRHQQLIEEEAEILEHLGSDQMALQTARASWEQALQRLEAETLSREEKLAARDGLQATVQDTKAKAREQADKTHRQEMEFQGKTMELAGLERSLERLQAQNQQLRQRYEQLELALHHKETPIEVLQAQLSELLEARITSEQHFRAMKLRLEDSQAQIRRLDDLRLEAEQQAKTLQTQIEAENLRLQEMKIRQQTIEEQLAETALKAEEVLNTVPEAANEASINHALEKVVDKIQRLGAINLAAIDEYKEQSERKEYLDAQNLDLEQALETLEAAIRKIDKETRSKFKETFDVVDGYFKEYFPKIFGGGSAYLELTGEDLLETGVTVMARPPGKKNSTIHLLSGGEKALTAVALVFSIFQLNPAPFCMLDEVDAPLDDANVGRFCRLVEAMSEKVQFIFISHNKVAIAMASQLIGVTMNEPGVSRIVSVDVEEAVTLAGA